MSCLYWVKSCYRKTFFFRKNGVYIVFALWTLNRWSQVKSEANLTLLLVGFLENVNWWGGGRFGPPVRSRELTGRFQWDKRHSVPLIVNFQNHHKKSKIRGPGSTNFQKFRDFHPITQIAITSLFLVRFFMKFCLKLLDE